MKPVLALSKGKPPVFQVHMFVSEFLGLIESGLLVQYCGTVKIGREIRAYEIQDRRHQIGMGRDLIRGDPSRDSWTSNDEWNIHVFLVAALLSRGQTMLTDMVTIIG